MRDLPISDTSPLSNALHRCKTSSLTDEEVFSQTSTEVFTPSIYDPEENLRNYVMDAIASSSGICGKQFK